jgi:hypothetical protein
VSAPDHLKKAEDDAINRGERPTTIIDIDIWAITRKSTCSTGRRRSPT